jgi:serine/threonine protein kinase
VLKSKDDKAFNQEVTVLRKLSTSKHTHVHLITLLATYKYHAAYHLIFPWADADLFDYWNQSEEAPPEDGQMGTWMIEQCRGLASGLNSIHRYATFSGTSILDAFTLPSGPETEEQCRATRTEDVKVNQSIRNLFGRHGDLKPQNILWYPDSRTTGGHGILKITDFGVTRFNTENMWDTQKTGKLPNSPTYRSPENDLDGKLTTACDVWALGCVYLEFVTWYFGGSRLIKEHGTSRLAPDPRMANMRTDTFFTIYEVAGRKRARVKPAVLKVS